MVANCTVRLVQKAAARGTSWGAPLAEGMISQSRALTATDHPTTNRTGLAATTRFAMRLSRDAKASPCWRARWRR